MVPATFVPLAALPLSPNGKLDRRALSAADPATVTPTVASTGNGHRTPRAGTERRLAEIWTEVLGVAEVGRDDHFLELGGDSILNFLVLSRIQAAFGVRLPTRALFDAPTVARRGRRGHRAGTAWACPAAVARAAPPAVPGRPEPARYRVQHRDRAASVRSVRPRGAPDGARRAGRAARVAAHHVRHRGRSGRSGHRRARVGTAAGLLHCGRFRRADPGRRAEPAVRPAAGPADPGGAGAGGRGRARAPAQPAPHRHRRLVGADTRGRAGDALRRRGARYRAGAARAADRLR